MKAVKHIAALCLVIVMVLSFAACAQTEKTVTLRGDITEDLGMGMDATDTFVLTAKGDIVQTIKEIMEIDFSEFSDEEAETAKALFDSLIVDVANEIEGVECSSSIKNGTYTIEITITCSGKTLKEVAEAGILELESDADRISLKKSQASLEAQGYKVVD